MNTQAFSAIFGMPPGMVSPELTGSPVNGENAVSHGFPGGFAQLLHVQNATSEVMEQLRAVLPVEEFTQLEAQVDGGNLLPLAEIVATLGQQQSAGGEGGAGQGQMPLAQIIAMMRNQQVADEQSLASPEEMLPVQQTAEEVLLADLTDQSGVQGAPTPPVDDSDLDVITSAEQSVPLPPVMEPFNIIKRHGEPVLPSTSAEQDQDALQGRPVPQSPQMARLMAALEKLDASFTAEGEGDASSMDSACSDRDDFLFKLGQEGLKSAEAMAARPPQIPPALGVLRRVFGAADAGAVTAAGTAQGMPHLQTSQITPPTSATPLPIDIHPGHKGWDQAMGERMMWMIGNRLQSAEVRITPPHLGPIDIRISIQHDQASVSFLAQHGVVREALESSIPRLREMLGENNLQLVNVDVGQRDASGQRGSADFSSHHGGNSGYDGFGLGGEMDAGILESEVRYYRGDGLLDAFA